MTTIQQDGARKVHAAQAKSASLNRTQVETVPISSLRAGDVVLSVGTVADAGTTQTFPFAFTLTFAQPLTYKGRVLGINLRAEHGWFTTVPLPATDLAVRVI